MFMTMSLTKTDHLQNLRMSMHLMNITIITQNNPVKALLDLACVSFFYLDSLSMLQMKCIHNILLIKLCILRD